MGIRGNTLKLMESFLKNRKQYVKLSKSESEEVDNNAFGVPQGSILGPLLYKLYVTNIMKANLLAKHIMFADDMVLLYTGKDVLTLETNINDDLVKFQNWLLSNKLIVNKRKTNYMLFRQKNKTINLSSIFLDGELLEERSTTK